MLSFVGHSFLKFIYKLNGMSTVDQTAHTVIDYCFNYNLKYDCVVKGNTCPHFGT